MQWQPGGERRIDAVFPDGLTLTVEFDGDEVSVSSEDPDEAVARLIAVDDLRRDRAAGQRAGWKGTSGECSAVMKRSQLSARVLA